MDATDAARAAAYLDDVRPCPAGFVLWRSYDEAISWMTEHGCPRFVSFDFDLGFYTPAMSSYLDGSEARTGLDVARWMIGRDAEGDFIPADFHFAVHSANPIGREWILADLGDHLVARGRAAEREEVPRG